MNPCNSAVTQEVPNLSSSADSQCCTNSIPCSHLKCSNFYVYWLHLEESYAEAYDFIQVLSAQFVASTKG